MSKYNVTVNGESFEVEIQKISDGDSSQIIEKTKEKEIPAKKPDPKPTNSKVEPLLAPMSGKIIEVLVSENQTVKKGEKLVILEAMKMENEITATEDMLIEKILCKVGDQVESSSELLYKSKV